jgi:hypothetical protein
MYATSKGELLHKCRLVGYGGMLRNAPKNDSPELVK